MYRTAGSFSRAAQQKRLYKYNTVRVNRHITRYDTRCYFNVGSKANISQLNLPHGANNSRRVFVSLQMKYVSVAA